MNIFLAEQRLLKKLTMETLQRLWAALSGENVLNNCGQAVTGCSIMIMLAGHSFSEAQHPTYRILLKSRFSSLRLLSVSLTYVSDEKDPFQLDRGDQRKT